jgi:nucleotide-binding universal stress UspA family protein
MVMVEGFPCPEDAESGFSRGPLRPIPDSAALAPGDSGGEIERRKTMKPILLATDGSPSAAEATREAVELARALGAPLVATAVEHVTAPSYGYYGYAEVYSELRKAETEHVHAVLADVARRAAEAEVTCETVALEGVVVDEICRLARERNAAMIVIGAHGWGAIKRLVFGSVSLGVLHEAPCPVLVARSPDPGETTWVDERSAATAA